MRNLLWAQKKPLFGQYYAWLKLIDIREPQKDIDAGMRQPDMIKVSWDQPDSNQSGGTQALSVSVVPNKGIFGAEYSLIYMIKEFRKKIVACLNYKPQITCSNCTIYLASACKEQQQPIAISADNPILQVTILNTAGAGIYKFWKKSVNVQLK